jgi:hypothetical protein
LPPVLGDVELPSLPTWQYDVPHTGLPELFEMPLLGYGGYLPFALGIHAFCHDIYDPVFRLRWHSRILMSHVGSQARRSAEACRL